MKKLFFLLVLIPWLSLQHLSAQDANLDNAWKAFNAHRYELAIQYCDSCIENSAPSALKKQHKLDSLKIVPETGAVDNEKKKEIFNNGALNDVATVYFLKGRSSESFYKLDKQKNSKYKQMANEAYKEACKYNKGRCWDVRGWFWSPCEASTDRLPVE